MAKKRRKPRRRIPSRSSKSSRSRSGDIINVKVFDSEVPIVPLLLVGGLIYIIAKQPQMPPQLEVITTQKET